MERINLYLSISVAAGLCLVGVYDAVAIYLWGRDATVSALIHEAAHQWPMLAFLAGVLAGHLFG